MYGASKKGSFKPAPGPGYKTINQTSVLLWSTDLLKKVDGNECRYHLKEHRRCLPRYLLRDQNGRMVCYGATVQPYKLD
jgi:hypothetical protein